MCRCGEWSSHARPGRGERAASSRGLFASLGAKDEKKKKKRSTGRGKHVKGSGVRAFEARKHVAKGAKKPAEA